MNATPSFPPGAAMVRLPADQARTHEELHVLAWRELLGRNPRAAGALVGRAARHLGATWEPGGAGTLIAGKGGCRSDLFITCAECRADQVVIEVKGPTAAVNFLEKPGAWQPVWYRDAYRADPALTCRHLNRPFPAFVLLDARNRDRKCIEQEEAYGEPILEGWAVLPYQEVLSRKPFSGDPVAAWLLNW